MDKKYEVPKNMNEKVEAIIKEIEVFCNENLNENFTEKAIELTSKLSRKRPSPLSGGRTKTWVAAILDTIMSINFVYDKSNPLHITKKDFVEKICVSQGTINKKSNEIMDLLNISIFSQEWFVEGNEKHTMASILDMERKVLEFNENISLLSEEDDEKWNEEVVDQEIFEIIESKDIDKLSEGELESFVELCTNIVCIMIGRIREGFENEDCYYESFDKAGVILNKSNNASIKIYEINKANTKPYFDVHYMMAEMCMEGNDFETALEQYEHIRKQCLNYGQQVEYKIFNIRCYVNDNVDNYLKSFDKENNAQWDYNRALYNYYINNELMAIDYLKEALKKNNIIASLLLDDNDINIKGDLSSLEKEAVQYYTSSKWIWMETEGALEWLFYKKQELKS